MLVMTCLLSGYGRDPAGSHTNFGQSAVVDPFSSGEKMYSTRSLS